LATGSLVNGSKVEETGSAPEYAGLAFRDHRGCTILTADDYRRILAVLEVAGRAQSLTQLRIETLAALEEHLGYRGSGLVLGTVGSAASDGYLHGRAQRTIEEYFERWRDHDAFNSAISQQLIRSGQTVSLEDIYRQLEPNRRRYVDEFLRSHRISAHVMVRLDTRAAVDGFLSVFSYDHGAFEQRDHLRLLALAPHLANLVRIHLPPAAQTPFAGRLSPRQTAVAELVADGCSNHEIARRLRVTDGTVKKHVSASLRALGLQRRTQLAIAWQAAATSTQTRQPTPARQTTTTHT
jgi:DNA-binding CsgD family transcriptional regulator